MQNISISITPRGVLLNKNCLRKCGASYIACSYILNTQEKCKGSTGTLKQAVRPVHGLKLYFVLYSFTVQFQ